MGGTTIYIAGSNFSPYADEITVLIGPYPCNLIASGSTVSMISCITTACTDPAHSQWALPVTVITANKLTQVCKSYSCLFDYSPDITPTITQIYPIAAIGN